MFVVAAIATAVAGAMNEEEIPEPPYIDEKGNVDWDKKYELDK